MPSHYRDNVCQKPPVASNGRKTWTKLYSPLVRVFMCVCFFCSLLLKMTFKDCFHIFLFPFFPFARSLFPSLHAPRCPLWVASRCMDDGERISFFFAHTPTQTHTHTQNSHSCLLVGMLRSSLCSGGFWLRTDGWVGGSVDGNRLMGNGDAMNARTAELCFRAVQCHVT